MQPDHPLRGGYGKDITVFSRTSLMKNEEIPEESGGCHQNGNVVQFYMLCIIFRYMQGNIRDVSEGKETEGGRI